jgi:hypothetical protein
LMNPRWRRRKSSRVRYNHRLIAVPRSIPCM